MIFADSDIFVIDLRYQRDLKYAENRQFLDHVIKGSLVTTSIFNILEVCGILSFNLNEQQLLDLYYHFPRKYNLQGITNLGQADTLPSFRLSTIIEVMSRKASLGDTMIICSVLDKIHQIDFFISWNANHFAGKISKPTLTPAEYLKHF
jgi:hypothetical protein